MELWMNLARVFHADSSVSSITLVHIFDLLMRALDCSLAFIFSITKM